MMNFLLALLLLSFLYPLHSTDTFSSRTFNFDVERYIVVPAYVLGLANRLRTISSVYTIAKVTKRHLVVIWVPNMDCNIGIFMYN
jgi:hypothetical protein